MLLILFRTKFWTKYTYRYDRVANNCSFLSSRLLYMIIDYNFPFSDLILVPKIISLVLRQYPRDKILSFTHWYIDCYGALSAEHTNRAHKLAVFCQYLTGVNEWLCVMSGVISDYFLWRYIQNVCYISKGISLKMYICISITETAQEANLFIHIFEKLLSR